MRVLPHGGQLIDRYHPSYSIESLTEEIEVDAFTLADMECISNGAFSPLEGFMNQQDYENVLHHMRLQDGRVWPMPITLSISKEQAEVIDKAAAIKLKHAGKVYGVLEIEDMYERQIEKEARLVYGTLGANHPGVARIYQQPCMNVGGKIHMLSRPARTISAAYYLDPKDTRAFFEEKGWNTIVGFQTRNPIHRAHEYIQKTALEVVDGLFIHPLVGETKKDDIPETIRMKSYEVLLDNYFPDANTLLGAYPAAMRYAGPREAVLHAIARKNYGCTHFIVGRDHAGVGKYYGTYDAQRIFKQFDKKELDIELLFFEHSFYCKECHGMASHKTCPHDDSSRFTLSGTKVREMLGKEQRPPKEFSRPEVVDVLINGLSTKPNKQENYSHTVWHDATVNKESRRKLLKQKSFVLWFTGLSGSGKSTIANRLEELLHEKGIATYLLDGDNVRQGLCSDLVFHEQDRQENIRRIGEVTKLFIDSGLVVLTAFISPFATDRQTVKALLREEEFIEVYVECSLAKCEERDPKGLYKKARKGEISHFTGISSPYEAPTAPHIHVNTERMTIDACVQEIWTYLRENQYVKVE
ncbi:sulfate adenylyltransferase [Virgibacillus sp. LDC-1]|uniref:sulfate adenylyltransferase n=1 Tax=Virgibacillus sp. LDC-1 TaxID=3039856 RepID=UPI0032E80391